MAITKATASAVAPAAKGDLVVGSATNDAAVLGVGSTGQVLTVDSSTTTGLKWSTAGISFTQRKVADSTNALSVAYNGSNLYVAVFSDGYLYTSSNGQTWTSRTSGFGSNGIFDIAYGNGLFVAVGANGTITTSSDGITWTARTANFSTNQFNSVYYANSTWVAVGEGGGTTNTGGLVYSTDGITWTRKSQSITVGASYKDVTWNGTNWFIGASQSTNNYLYASTPSGTWTAGVNGSNAIEWCGYDGTRTIIIRSSTLYFTTSTTFASFSQINGVGSFTNDRKPNYLYNGILYSLTPSLISYFDTSTLAQGITGAWYAGGYKNLLNPMSTGVNANPSISGNNGFIFVNDSGFILGSDSGALWTSF